jgi:hypothetical protein
VQLRQKINAQLSGTPDSSAQSGVTPERWTGPRGVEGGPRSFGPGATAAVSKTPLTRDWSMDVGGSADSETLTIATPLTSSNLSGGVTVTIDGVTLTASAPVAATETGTFTGNPTTGQTVTIGGTEVLYASPSTAGTQTGTFSGTPTAATAITVGYGGNTLTLKTNATPSSVVGTAEGGVPASGATISIATGTNALVLTDSATSSSSATGTVLADPESGTIPTITITNVVTGTMLTLLPSGTGESVTGTFLGVSPSAGPAVGQTIVISEQQNANTLTLTGVTGGAGTITVSGIPSVTVTVLGESFSALTIGTITYTFQNTCGTTAYCIVNKGTGLTTTGMAQNIAAAITANSALCSAATPTCFGTATTAFPNVAAKSSGAGVTVTNYGTAALTWSYQGYVLPPDTNLTLLPTTSIPAGTNGCTSSTTGTFVINPTSAIGAAANVNAAINACLAAYPATGLTSTVSLNVITVSDAVTGTYSSITPNPGSVETAANFTWSISVPTPGKTGTNTCSGSTVAYFASGLSAGSATSDVASNISSDITNCFSASGITSAYTSGNTFTVTNLLPGASLAVGGAYPNVFSWSPTTGSNGTTGCSSSTAGSYMTSYTAPGLAANIAAALASCNTNYPAVGLTTAYTAGATSFTVSTPLPGTTQGISSVSTTEASNVFQWGTPVAGTPGSNTCSSLTTGTYMTSTSTTTLAANLAAAISLCPTGTGLASATSAGNVVTVTASQAGATSGVTLGATNSTGIFAWGGAGITNGVSGLQGLSGGKNYFTVNGVLATDAANLYSAINGYTGGLVTASARSGATFTVTDNTPGTGGNSLTTASAATGFAWTGSTLSGGTNGTANATNFPYWTGTTYVSSPTLASNMATAIAANSMLNPLMTATPGTGTGGIGTLLLTSNADGASGAYTVTKSFFGFSALTIPSGTLTGGAAGGAAGQSPAKYSYWNGTLTAANCTSDFVVYPTSTVGSATQATIIAYNNMYKSPTCTTGAVPSIYWAYNTGGGRSILSPIFNFSGTEVAYIQDSGTGSAASLVLLTMPAIGTAWTGTVQTLTAVAASAYHGCTAPCYTTLPLSAADSNSAPWWDYANDVIYVGDNAGKLHKFANVFISGTPAEVGSPFAPITSTTGLEVLSGPVVDGATHNIYISEGYTTGNPPFMAQVTSAGAVTYSHAGAGTGLGSAYLDAPIVDQSAGRVYAFIGDDGATTGAKSSAVYQLTESTFTSAPPIEAKLGTGSTGVFEYAGSFDNTYFNSAVPATPTGTLYVCGYASGVPTLYSIPITGATGMSTTATARTTLTGGGATCSPISEVDNGTSDYFFLSVTANGNKAGCEGACVYSYAGTPALPASGTLIPTASAPASGGAGEIIIDNTSSGGGSQIYYTTLSSQLCAGNGTTGSGTGACAVQESQSALQ